ncbi:putative non-specific serine/threonine protein kinase [Rosa chinensis]|uniref:Putative non-specific serine/threonine protein kinase n=1 Tax=Rosa chinensis TaxID=74649 RepID=A0A2P6SH73_ROSCH|nr:putative non-specific serine/threonine protein kinase [Rosa chinensis]
MHFKHQLEIFHLWRPWTFLELDLQSTSNINRKSVTLVTLDLSNNTVLGPLPTSIEHLSHLQTLKLLLNSISSQLPTSIRNLSHLQTLDLSYNSISDPLPTSIGKLSHLETLHLPNNSISGPLPTSIGNLSHCKPCTFPIIRFPVHFQGGLEICQIWSRAFPTT